jgi:hypothetical protein
MRPRRHRRAVNDRPAAASADRQQGGELMSRHKLGAALAAVATTVAVALPAGASAATTTTIPPITIPPFTIGLGAGYVQSVMCPILVSQLQLATATGNTLGANLIANVLLYSGCGGAAI